MQVLKNLKSEIKHNILNKNKKQAENILILNPQDEQ